MQAQAPICPFCTDDHASDVECRVIDLKKVIILLLLDDVESLLSNEDLKYTEQLKRLVNWI